MRSPPLWTVSHMHLNHALRKRGGLSTQTSADESCAPWQHLCVDLNRTKRIACTAAFVAMLAVAIAVPGIGHALETGPSTTERDIAVGGVDGFASLANPENTRELRSSGRVRLYVHKEAWFKTDAKTQAAIVRAFAGTGPASLEVGESGNPKEYWPRIMKSFRAAGLAPDQANVNAAKPSKSSLTVPQWKAYVDEARSLGIRVVAPVITPNDRSWINSPFSAPAWDEVRERATYGGGLTVDSPAWFFLRQPRGYQRFVEDELIWARKAGLQATLILSPPRDNAKMGDFDGQSRKMLQVLNAADASPNAYVIENYMGKPPPNFRYMIGNEHDPQSITGFAQWVVHNIPRAKARNTGVSQP